MTERSNRWDSLGGRKPDLFIVGAPKCGTSSMHAYLGAHPEIFMSEIKEPHFLSSDLEKVRPHRIDTIERYLACFAPATSERRAGEASPSYLYSAHALREIEACASDPRIIVMIRNPVHMMHSLHSGRVMLGTEPLARFEDAIASDPERSAASAKYFPMDGGAYRDAVRYRPHLERYLERFGDRVHVVVFEEFQLRTAETYAEVLRFLGVDRSFVPSFETRGANRVMRSSFVHRFMHSPPAVARWAFYGLLPRRARVRLWTRTWHWNAKDRPRDALSAQLAAALWSEFEPETRRLSALLGRDLFEWWTPPSDQPRASRTGSSIRLGPTAGE